MPNKTSREKDKFLTDLDYADDIALTTSLLQDAQDLLTSLEDASPKFGLFLNTQTEYMSINGDEDQTPILSRDGTQLIINILGHMLLNSRKDVSDS